jgi:hypothetical protein
MRRSRAPSNWPGPFFAAQSWAGYTTNMFGFDLRQAQLRSRVKTTAFDEHVRYLRSGVRNTRLAGISPAKWPGQPFLGSGETGQGPAAASIANAVASATGKRLRDLPLTRKRIKDAIGA